MPPGQSTDAAAGMNKGFAKAAQGGGALGAIGGLGLLGVFIMLVGYAFEKDVLDNSPAP